MSTSPTVRPPIAQNVVCVSSTYGGMLWSSSKYSNTGARFPYTNNGYVYDDTSEYISSKVRRVRASTYGLALWSSSEISQNGARDLSMKNGNDINPNKNYYYTYFRVRDLFDLRNQSVA